MYKETPYLSVILPVFNVCKYIDKCIESLLSQSYKNFEAIFVNDGSTDDFLDYFSSLNLDDRFKVYTKKNEGSGLARNYGMNKAKGKYFYFMDPDDSIDKNFFYDITNLIDSSHVDVIISGYSIINSENSKKRLFLPGIETYFDNRESFFYSIETLQKKINMNPVWNKVYKASFLKDNKLYFSNMRTGQDAIFNWNVYDKVEKVYVLNRAYYNYYHKRDGSAQNSYKKDNIINDITILNTMKKYASKWKISSKLEEMILNYQISIIFKEIISLKKIGKNNLPSILNNDVYLELLNKSIIDTKNIKAQIKLILIKTKIIFII